jgi:hypothetical protein
MMSVMFGVIELMPRFKQNRLDLGDIFIHEMSRAALDRQFDAIKREKQFDDLVEIASKCFRLDKKDVSIRLDKPSYSYIKAEYNDYYSKVDSEKEELATILEYRDIYN